MHVIELERIAKLRSLGAEVWYPVRHLEGGWIIAAPTRIGVRTSLGDHVAVSTIPEVNEMSESDFYIFCCDVKNALQKAA